MKKFQLLFVSAAALLGVSTALASKTTAVQKFAITGESGANYIITNVTGQSQGSQYRCDAPQPLTYCTFNLDAAPGLTSVPKSTVQALPAAQKVAGTYVDL